MAEAFVKTFKRDYIYIHDRPDAKMVMAQLNGWFNDYNNKYHSQVIKTKITQRIFSGSCRVTMAGFIGATPVFHDILLNTKE